MYVAATFSLIFKRRDIMKKTKKLPVYDENSIMMHWSNTSACEEQPKKTTQGEKSSKCNLPEYDENSIMMHWSNTSC